MKKSINLEPNWTQMFRLAVQLTKQSKPDGWGMIVEMLEYGQRLHEQTDKGIEQTASIEQA